MIFVDFYVFFGEMLMFEVLVWMKGWCEVMLCDKYGIYEYVFEDYGLIRVGLCDCFCFYVECFGIFGVG